MLCGDRRNYKISAPFHLQWQMKVEDEKPYGKSNRFNWSEIFFQLCWQADDEFVRPGHSHSDSPVKQSQHTDASIIMSCICFHANKKKKDKKKRQYYLTLPAGVLSKFLSDGLKMEGFQELSTTTLPSFLLNFHFCRVQKHCRSELLNLQQHGKTYWFCPACRFIIVFAEYVIALQQT